jgi:ribonuclease BN (tRNA processing enzyme)
LKRAGIDPATIGWVLLSHLHGDHFGGLPFLILDGQFSRRTSRLVVAGPPGLRERLTRAQEALFPGSSTVERRFAVEVVELQERVETAVGPFRATAFAVDHASGAPAYALRLVAGGRTIACSGDTAWTDTLIELAAGADLLIAEAYFWDKPVPYHLRHADLVAHRHQLTNRRTILTHLSEDMLAHADHAAFAVAHDGLVLDL